MFQKKKKVKTRILSNNFVQFLAFMVFDLNAENKKSSNIDFLQNLKT